MSAQACDSTLAFQRKVRSLINAAEMQYVFLKSEKFFFRKVHMAVG